MSLRKTNHELKERMFQFGVERTVTEPQSTFLYVEMAWSWKTVVCAAMNHQTQPTRNQLENQTSSVWFLVHASWEGGGLYVSDAPLPLPSMHCRFSGCDCTVTAASPYDLVPCTEAALGLLSGKPVTTSPHGRGRCSGSTASLQGARVLLPHTNPTPSFLSQSQLLPQCACLPAGRQVCVQSPQVWLLEGKIARYHGSSSRTGREAMGTVGSGQQCIC